MEAVQPQVAGSGASVSALLSGTPLEVLRMLRMTGSTIDELRLILGVSRREIEEAVETLRRRGEPILAGNEGLRLSEDADEVMAYVEARRRRTVTIYLGTRALRQTARRLKEAQDMEQGLTLWAA